VACAGTARVRASAAVWVTYAALGLPVETHLVRLCARQFYNKEEAAKYATNSRMREIQTSLTERALELLSLPSEDCFVLDVGCGSGLSGECLTESGHQWIGCDISNDMLMVAKEQEVEGDVVLNDMGQVSSSVFRFLSLSFFLFRSRSVVQLRTPSLAQVILDQ